LFSELAVPEAFSKMKIKMNESCSENKSEVDKKEPIQQLLSDLTRELRRDPTGPNVPRLMKEYISNFDDWKDYMHFNQFKYARNLVGNNETLELMVICWLKDQVSPIHNHSGQHCWAAVLEGSIIETHFQFRNTHATAGYGPLEVVQEHIVQTGNVSYISDDIALHILKPSGGLRAATLHLYSKPIEECNIYCPITGEITKRRLGYYSINKKINEAFAESCCMSPTVT